MLDLWLSGFLGLMQARELLFLGIGMVIVVIGRGVMHETFGRVRTKSYDIIRQSPCPVLLTTPTRWCCIAL